jgi:hypothetical protein
MPHDSRSFKPRLPLRTSDTHPWIVLDAAGKDFINCDEIDRDIEDSARIASLIVMAVNQMSGP